MAVSIAATSSLRGLTALLFAAALNISFAAAEGVKAGSMNNPSRERLL